MTRKQALARARAVKAAKRAQANGRLQLELTRDQGMFLYETLESVASAHASAIRRQIVAGALKSE
jgi:hypothetical protein